MTGLVSVMGFAIPILYDIFMLIDSIIYFFASLANKTFFWIAENGNFMGYSEGSASLEYITAIFNRLFLLVGIYALFKLSITLIQLLINPDNSEQEAINGGAYLKRIIIAILALLVSRFAFEQLTNIQTMILKQNVIGKVIYGSDNDSSVDYASQSEQFSNKVWLLFFRLEDGDSCEDNNTNHCKAYHKVMKGESLLILGAYMSDFEYYPIISGIVGIALCYFFIQYCIELAIRMLKLLVLQLISPIPILMSIIPKEKDRLVTFVKLYIDIYLQLFIRIITVYLAFVVITIVFSVLEELDANFLVTVLMLVGVFRGARELPKLLEDTIGLKMDNATGGTSFGSLVGGIVGGGLGLLAGGIAGGIQGGAGGALAGAYSGLASGIETGNNGLGIRNMIAATTGGVAAGGQTGANIRGAGGLGNYVVGGVENFFGGQGRDKATIEQTSQDYDERIKEKNEQYDEGIEQSENAMKTAEANKSGYVQEKSKMVSMDDHRKTFESSYDRKYGSLDSMLENNSDYLAARQHYSEASTDQARSIALKGLNEERAKVESNYHAQRDRYFKENFDARNKGIGTMDEDFRKALEDYNNYAQSNDLADYVIESYQGDSRSGMQFGAENSEGIFVDVGEKSNNTQSSLDSLVDTCDTIIERERTEQERLNKREEVETLKKQKEQAVKDLEESPNFRRRNNRTSDRTYRPRQ